MTVKYWVLPGAIFVRKLFSLVAVSLLTAGKAPTKDLTSVGRFLATTRFSAVNASIYWPEVALAFSTVLVLAALRVSLDFGAVSPK